MRAVECPVCKGKGRTHFYDSTGTSGEECHACKGKGYLWTPEEEDPIDVELEWRKGHETPDTCLITSGANGNSDFPRRFGC